MGITVDIINKEIESRKRQIIEVGDDTSSIHKELEELERSLLMLTKEGISPTERFKPQIPYMDKLAMMYKDERDNSIKSSIKNCAILGDELNLELMAFHTIP